MSRIEIPVVAYPFASALGHAIMTRWKPGIPRKLASGMDFSLESMPQQISSNPTVIYEKSAFVQNRYSSAKVAAYH
jgi:hypothetical protein